MDEQHVAVAAAPGPAQIVPVSQLLRGAWDYYKNHFRRLLLISLVSWIAIALVTIIGAALGIVNQKQPNQFTPAMGIGLVVYLVVVIVAACWQYLALVYAVSPEGEALKTMEVYGHSKRWLASYIGAAILVGIIVIVGLILLVVPGIIFGVWFSLVCFIIVRENQGAIKAMKASRQYVKGHFSAVFSRWIVMGLIALGLSIVLGIIGALLGNTVHSLVNLLFSLLFTPFAVVYGSRLYESVRQVKSSV